MEPCLLHPKIETALIRIEKHTTEIVNGMYGSLDSPGTGFIHEVRKDREFTRAKMEEFEQSIKDIKKLFNGSVTAIVGGIVTIATAVVVAAVNGWIK